MKIKHLTIKWTVSKGRNTYGYNIVTLYDTSSRKRFRTSGGGYDMVGTVFGDWLESEYQEQLLANRDKVTALYGAAFRTDRISLDGACGLECMVSIAEAIGLTVQRIYDPRTSKGGLIGFNVV